MIDDPVEFDHGAAYRIFQIAADFLIALRKGLQGLKWSSLAPRKKTL
jgi:hypothetical protein